jgi:hypothetical protein
MASTKLTITEALAEIKTINARLQKKRESIGTNLMRDSRIKDPMESEGGSEEFIRKETQAIDDLQKRIVSIRTAIQQQNLVTAAARFLAEIGLSRSGRRRLPRSCRRFRVRRERSGKKPPP